MGHFGANKVWIEDILGPQFRKEKVDNKKRKLLLIDLSHIKDMCVYFKGNGWASMQALFQLSFGNVLLLYES
jgi:hypothetical protein